MERPRQDSGKVNMIKEYYINVWKCYYETHNFLQLIMIINKGKKPSVNYIFTPMARVNCQLDRIHLASPGRKPSGRTCRGLFCLC